MPLPLLIGLAVVTGGVGIAKGIGAADTQSKANNLKKKWNLVENLLVRLLNN